jgi:hypothetical protein
MNESQVASTVARLVEIHALLKPMNSLEWQAATELRAEFEALNEQLTANMDRQPAR